MAMFEIVDAGDRVQIVDKRGRYVESFATRHEAETWLAGYRVGQADAAAVVRVQAEQIARIASEAPAYS